MVAWIVNSWSPAARFSYVCPETHGSKSSPSIEQPNVTFGWLAAKVKVALRLERGRRPGPCSSVVVGGADTVHV